MTREEAKVILKGFMENPLYSDIPKVCRAFDMAIKALEQQKAGHWISGHKETGALGITYTEKICSNCGWNHSLVIPKNYCPNCGAKMIEPQESEDQE